MSRPSFSPLSPEQRILKLLLNPIYLQAPELHTGYGALAELPYILERDGIKSAFILCSGSVRRTGKLSRFIGLMQDIGIEYVIHEAVSGEPSYTAANDIADAIRESSCKSVILIGGGSVLDCGKAAALSAANGFPAEKLNPLGIGHKPSLPIYAVPTTSGTGSEVTPFSVLLNTKNGKKYSLISNMFMPAAVILDTSLAADVPQDTAAGCAMDALAHSIESYANKLRVPEDMSFSLRACRLVFENAENYINSRSDKKAAAGMMRASYDAGLGFRHTGCGNIHAAAHALGEKYKLPHGTAIAYVMPFVLKEYLYDPAACNALAVMAVKSGCAEVSDGRLAAAEKFVGAVRRLESEIGIPADPGCVFEKDITPLAQRAFSEAKNSGSPVRFSVRMFEEIFRKLSCGRNI